MSMENNFRTSVINFIKKIPQGKVVSYGQVAASCGNPRASRQVGGILGALGIESGVPWWRVVNRDGLITIKNQAITKEQQKTFLEKDGVEVSSNFVIDMKKYQFKLKY